MSQLIANASVKQTELKPLTSVTFSEGEKPYLLRHSITGFHTMRHAVPEAAVIASTRGKPAEIVQNVT